MKCFILFVKAWHFLLLQWNWRKRFTNKKLLIRANLFWTWLVLIIVSQFLWIIACRHRLFMAVYTSWVIIATGSWFETERRIRFWEQYNYLFSLLISFQFPTNAHSFWVYCYLCNRWLRNHYSMEVLKKGRKDWSVDFRFQSINKRGPMTIRGDQSWRELNFRSCLTAISYALSSTLESFSSHLGHVEWLFK